jgi:hypothetical protein
MRAPRVACPTGIRRPPTRHLASHMIRDDISIVDPIHSSAASSRTSHSAHSRSLRKTCLSLLVASARPRAPFQELVLTLSSLTHLPLNGLLSAKRLSIMLQVPSCHYRPKVRINMSSLIGTTALWRRIRFVLSERRSSNVLFVC